MKMKKVKEVDLFLKMVSEGLKAISQGVEAFARKIDEVTTRPTEPEAPIPQPQSTPTAKDAEGAKGKAKGKGKAGGVSPRKPGTKKAPGKKAPRPRQSGREGSATQQVLKLIAAAPEGLDTAGLSAQTGFNQRKIHNIVYKLKKQGTIQAANGVYRTA
jgi:hypothetical protein